jgi:hypothetical protein
MPSHQVLAASGDNHLAASATSPGLARSSQKRMFSALGGDGYLSRLARPIVGPKLESRDCRQGADPYFPDRVAAVLARAFHG